jgi:hypothetical protein
MFLDLGICFSIWTIGTFLSLLVVASLFIDRLDFGKVDKTIGEQFAITVRDSA